MATALGSPQPYASSSARADRLIPCSFCPERYSSRELGDHLLRCGNKTEQCPNCHKYIRRAIFAYHYENQCSEIPEEEQTKKTSDAATIVNCEFCAQRCASRDYLIHQENCLENPKNQRHRSTESSSKEVHRRSRRQKPDPPSDIVRIPCEYCEEPIDLPNWAAHTALCREKDKRRLEARAQEINREAIVEQIPCEHCQRAFSTTDLHRHEITCEENPSNKRLSRRRPVTTERESVLSNDERPVDRHHHQGLQRDGPSSTLATRGDRSSLMVSAYDRTSPIHDLLATIDDPAPIRSSFSMSPVKIDDQRDPLINGTARPSRSIDREEYSRERQRSVEPAHPTLTNSAYDTPALLRERSASLQRSIPRREPERSSVRPFPPVTKTPSSSASARSTPLPRRNSRGSVVSGGVPSLDNRHLRGQRSNPTFATPDLRDETHQAKILGSPKERPKSTASRMNQLAIPVLAKPATKKPAWR